MDLTLDVVVSNIYPALMTWAENHNLLCYQTPQGTTVLLPMPTKSEAHYKEGVIPQIPEYLLGSKKLRFRMAFILGDNQSVYHTNWKKVKPHYRNTYSARRPIIVLTVAPAVSRVMIERYEIESDGKTVWIKKTVIRECQVEEIPPSHPLYDEVQRGMEWGESNSPAVP